MELSRPHPNLSLGFHRAPSPTIATNPTTGDEDSISFQMDSIFGANSIGTPLRLLDRQLDDYRDNTSPTTTNDPNGTDDDSDSDSDEDQHRREEEIRLLGYFMGVKCLRDDGDSSSCCSSTAPPSQTGHGGARPREAKGPVRAWGNQPLATADLEIHQVMEWERRRYVRGVEFIASENFSPIRNRRSSPPPSMGGDSSEVGNSGAAATAVGDGGTTININIRCSTGNKFSVKAGLDSTVESFKHLIAESSEVSVEQQRLIYKGRILKDDQTPQSYGSTQEEQYSSLENTQFCSDHEGCTTHLERINNCKGFVAKEPVKGHMVNVVKGLKLYEDMFLESELSRLGEFINDLRVAGHSGELSGCIQRDAKLKVGMHCEKCIKSIKKATKKIEDIETYKVDTEMNKVTTTGNVTHEEVLKALHKIGKTATYWREEEPIPPAKIADGEQQV